MDIIPFPEPCDKTDPGLEEIALFETVDQNLDGDDLLKELEDYLDQYADGFLEKMLMSNPQSTTGSIDQLLDVDVLEVLNDIVSPVQNQNCDLQMAVIEAPVAIEGPVVIEAPAVIELPTIIEALAVIEDPAVIEQPLTKRGRGRPRLIRDTSASVSVSPK